MPRIIHVLPRLPAGVVNSEAVRAAKAAQAKPKTVTHGPKRFSANSHPPVKIPDEVVRAMRWASEHERKPLAAVAEAFRVDRQACRALLDYRTRSHLDPAPLPPGFVWPR